VLVESFHLCARHDDSAMIHSASLTVQDRAL
jgi:hypothetical protein